MKTFFRDLLGMLVMAVCLLSAVQAQGVPGAIKYQAVLRDVNGKTLVNKNDVNIRISLRLDEPVSGTIAYSEVHEGVSTNAYGVIHLEIGRGEVTSGTTLNAIAWGEHKVYVQIEIETDGTGYTHMGNSELLTVPYAFYAENASGKNLYEHLKDNFIPKYNEANKTLVNSGLSQKDRALEVDASSITFVDRSTGKSGYTFPMEAGKKGQVLRLADNMGTLMWDTAGGGGASFNFSDLDDGRMVYWNNNVGDLQTAPFVFDYANSTNFSLTGLVSGINNILLADSLGDGQIWIGDGHSAHLNPRNLSGHIGMDKNGKTALNLEFDGIQLVVGQNGNKDTLRVKAQSSGSHWIGNADGSMYAANKDEANPFVGIGTESPQSKFHVSGGDVRFDGPQNAEGNTPSFFWNEAKASLFAGALSSGAVLPAVQYAVALGLDAQVTASHSMALGSRASAAGNQSLAIGVESAATEEHSMAIGYQSKSEKINAIAMGFNAVSSQKNAVAIGMNTQAIGINSVVLGGNSIARENSLILGHQNKNSDPNGLNSIVLGNNNSWTGENTILIGSNIACAGDESIIILKDLANIDGSGNIIPTSTPTNSLIIGAMTGGTFSGPIVYGSTTFTSGNPMNLTSVGHGNAHVNNLDDQIGFCNLWGSYLSNDGGQYKSLTMLGDNYSASSAHMSIDAGEAQPSLMYGSLNIFDSRGEAVAFEISNLGNAYFVGNVNAGGNVNAAGTVTANGVDLASDIRLKTNIRPMIWTPDLLDSIQPVSYVFKSDNKQRTRFGFIAQDVRRIFPELVNENNKGMLSMDYIGLVPVLWQINQQLSQKVNALEEQVAEQSRKQLELEKELEAIKAKLGM